MPIKSCKLPNGKAGFRWGNEGTCYPTIGQAEKQAAAAHANGYVGDIALDASGRTYDKDGRLHIARSHISKANIGPYSGNEIPNAEMLGLDPLKVYYLLRSPEELEKGASTFARLPILRKHIPVSSASPRQDLIVGSIGSDVNFLSPYLDADVCIWDDKAIAGIETEIVREFSCAYHYVAVMTPGEFEGEHYDGIMTEIQGNHLALVEAGRAGPDVLAADSKLRDSTMAKTKFGKALSVALSTAFPKLAQDSAFAGLFEKATKANFDKTATRAKLVAMDADAPAEQIDAVMDALMDVEDDPEPKEDKGKKRPAEDEDEETEEEKKAREKKEAKDKAAKDKAAKDEKDEDEKKGEEKMKGAMDAFRIGLRQAEEARRDVRPIVGDLVIAQDSAADIYRIALDHLNVEHKGITETSALKAMVKLAGTKTAPTSAVIAQDSAALETQFPNISRFSIG